jgi:hypothetical protein
MKNEGMAESTNTAIQSQTLSVTANAEAGTFNPPSRLLGAAANAAAGKFNPPSKPLGAAANAAAGKFNPPSKPLGAAAKAEAGTFNPPSKPLGAAAKAEAGTFISPKRQDTSFNLQERNMSDPTREEISALIKVSEKDTEIKLTRLEGKIDTLTATIVGKIDALTSDVSKADQFNHESRSVLLSTIVTVGISTILTLAVLGVALQTYGDALFGRGMNVRDVVQAVIKEQQEVQKKDVVSPPATPSSSATPIAPPATPAPLAKTKNPKQ